MLYSNVQHCYTILDWLGSLCCPITPTSHVPGLPAVLSTMCFLLARWTELVHLHLIRSDLLHLHLQSRSFFAFILHVFRLFLASMLHPGTLNHRVVGRSCLRNAVSGWVGLLAIAYLAGFDAMNLIGCFNGNELVVRGHVSRWMRLQASFQFVDCWTFGGSLYVSPCISRSLTGEWAQNQSG